MTELELKGIFPPIPTPFVEGGVSYDKLALNVEKWSGTGIKGLVVLGSPFYLCRKGKNPRSGIFFQEPGCAKPRI